MPIKKRLVVCCDGTWNDADSSENFTNVVRIARAILPFDTRNGQEIPQIVYYHSGVGSGDLVDRVVGGSVGIGLSRNVRDAYAFLAHNYCEGDEIFLFGFSRGAYTARSVGGLIGHVGLLRKRDMDDFAVVWESFRLRDKPGHVDVLDHFGERRHPVPIKCIGVWDTVGALGIPGHLDAVFTSFYEFHDTGLGEHVDNAFHALALDERRIDFAPTLWQQVPAARDRGQVLRQVWFPGVHSNVGGGYEEHGLSDVALAWMAAQVADLIAIDTDYLRDKRDLRNGWGMGKLYDSAGPAWELRGTKARQPLAPDKRGPTCESVHASVLKRLQPGAACVPRPYVSEALAGIDVQRAAGALAPIEQALQWTDAQIAAPAPSDRPEPSFLERLLKPLGGG
jgi:uncharacterized protein (DUF2235 family)